MPAISVEHHSPVPLIAVSGIQQVLEHRCTILTVADGGTDREQGSAGAGPGSGKWAAQVPIWAPQSQAKMPCAGYLLVSCFRSLHDKGYEDTVDGKVK